MDPFASAVPNPRKPISVEHRPAWCGRRWTMRVLAQLIHPTYGVCQLDSVRENTVTTYYVRMGRREDGVWAGGGMPCKRYSVALERWERLVESARVAIELASRLPPLPTLDRVPAGDDRLLRLWYQSIPRGI